MEDTLTRQKKTPICNKPFAWVDVETTGLDPDANDIIEIAIVRVDPDGEKVFHEKIAMERPENAHPKALEVNGYTPEKWKDAKPAVLIFPQVADLLTDCILAGQNTRFDAGFLNATFKRLGLDVRADYHLYDTSTLAMEHLKPWLESVSLVPVCKALGIPTNGAHTAMADVRMAMAVDQKLRRATWLQRLWWRFTIPRRLAK